MRTRAVRSDVARVAQMLATTPRALQAKLARELRKSTTGVVRFDGIRAEKNGRRHWILFIGEGWHINGALAAWVPLNVAAKHRGTTSQALRRALERLPVEADGTVFVCADIRARKFGRRWLLCFQDPCVPAGKGTVAA